MKVRDAQMPRLYAVPGETFFYLLMCSDELDGIETLRIASENRYRALRDGKEHDKPRLALLDTRQADHLAAQVAGLQQLEAAAIAEIGRAVKATPYAGFISRTPGIGPKQGARLLGAIGDPYWNAAEGRPRRGPAELWAYCGYAPGQKRRKGVKANWNATAKMRAFLCAQSAIKAGVRRLPDCDDTSGYDLANREALSPYGEVYLAARANWASTDTSDGHRHNHALRLVAKAILRDLWVEGRDHVEHELPRIGVAAPSSTGATNGTVSKEEPRRSTSAQATPCTTPVPPSPELTFFGEAV